MALRYEDIEKEFKAAVDGDPKCQKLWKTIREGKGNYKTANKLAQQIGKDLGKTLVKHAPYEDINEWDLIDLLPKSLGLDHQMVADACREVQENMNKKSGLGIKFQEPKFDMDRVTGLIKELEDHPVFTDIEKSFMDQLVNFSENVVDESIRDNAAIMAKSGIRTMVIRQAEFKACDWCQEVAGSYDYNDVKDKGNDVWRRHENCHCTIDYITEKTSGFYTERVYNYKK